MGSEHTRLNGYNTAISTGFGARPGGIEGTRKGPKGCWLTVKIHRDGVLRKETNETKPASGPWAGALPEYFFPAAAFFSQTVTEGVYKRRCRTPTALLFRRSLGHCCRWNEMLRAGGRRNLKLLRWGISDYFPHQPRKPESRSLQVRSLPWLVVTSSY